MACEICGRGNCCKSFHSIEQQQEHDDSADPIKSMIESEILAKVNRLSCEEIDGEYFVNIDKVVSIIESVCF